MHGSSNDGTVRAWWDEESPDERSECRRCGKADPIATLGRFQLCTECRLATDRCTMCGELMLHGEWWCPECELSLAEYLH